MFWFSDAIATFFIGLIKRRPWGPLLLVCVLPGIAARLLVVNNERKVQASAEDKKSMISEIQPEKVR